MTNDHTYTKIAQAIEFISTHRQRQPSLTEVASHVAMSEFHFQRLFVEWAGISPKKFLQYLTLDYAKERLRAQESLAEVAFEAGLSGTGRLHDLFVRIEGVTPGEYKQQGEAMHIDYGVFDSPFGAYFLAALRHPQETYHICRLEFCSEARSITPALEALQKEWGKAHIAHNPQALESLHESIFHPKAPKAPFSLLVRGTPFQIKVWEALLTIPEGALASYNEVAARIGRASASRAVGTAIGANPIAYLIPCHRAIKKTGAFGKYHWGEARKMAIIGWEASRQ